MPRNKICFLQPQELNEEIHVFIYVPPPKQTGDRSALAQAKIAISTNLLQTFNIKRWTQSGITVAVSVPESEISKIWNRVKKFSETNGSILHKHSGLTFSPSRREKAARMVGNCIANKHCYLQTANETNDTFLN